MGQTDRPDDRRAAGSRLPSNSESAVKRNHETPKSGIPKRKKIEACPRLSCKIQYLLASNHSDQSTASEYFTDDSIVFVKKSERKRFANKHALYSAEQSALQRKSLLNPIAKGTMLLVLLEYQEKYPADTSAHSGL